MPPPTPPAPPAPLVFDQQSFMGAIQLLRDQKLRGFRIDIETQSTIAADEAQERQDAAAFVQAMGAFMQSSLPMAQSIPQSMPILGAFMLFMCRRYAVGVELEGKLEDMLSKLEGNPAGAIQNPRAGEAAMKQQMMEASLQIKQQDAELKAETARQNMAQDAQEHAMALEGKRIELQGDMVRAQAEQQRAVLEDRMAQAEHARQLELANVQHRQALAQALMPAQPQAAPALGGGVPLAPQKLAFGAGVLTQGTR